MRFPRLWQNANIPCVDHWCDNIVNHRVAIPITLKYLRMKKNRGGFLIHPKANLINEAVQLNMLLWVTALEKGIERVIFMFLYYRWYYRKSNFYRLISANDAVGIVIRGVDRKRKHSELRFRLWLRRLVSIGSLDWTRMAWKMVFWLVGSSAKFFWVR